MTNHYSTSMQFIESIRISDGMIQLPHLHQQRMEATCREVYGRFRHPSPATIPIPGQYRIGEVKLRIIYSRDDMQWEFIPYTPRPVATLRLIDMEHAPDYHLKYADRSALDHLRAMRGDCDEIIISHRGHPCDTTYTNLLLTDGRRLVTPTTCLLPGVMRRHLIESGRAIALPLTNEALRPGNPYGFTHIIIINAMMNLNFAPRIALENISFPDDCPV